VFIILQDIYLPISLIGTTRIHPLFQRKQRRTQVMRRKRIAFLVAYGPEVRAFIHSGFVKAVAENHDVSIIARVRKPSAFGSSNGIPVLEMPAPHETHCVARLRNSARQSKIAWLEAQGRSRWRHYLPGKPKEKSLVSRLVGKALGTSCGSRTVGALERLAGRYLGSSVGWKECFENPRVDCLVTSGFSAPMTTPALQTAANLGIKTLILTNSWKDVYVSPHIPVPPTRLVVWNEIAKEDLLSANPNLKAETVGVGAPLQLDSFLNVRMVMNRDEFCRKAGIAPSRPYISYTAAAPAAVEREEFVVEALAEAIGDGRLPRHAQILLRLNPMEEGSRFAGLAAKYPFVVIQKPMWEWDPANDWNCPLAEDSEMWVGTVLHAALNVSIPSTVTLEFAGPEKPVVNVCFDLPQPLSAERSCRRFWDAPFYAEARRSPLVEGAFSMEELVSRVAKALKTVESRQRKVVNSQTSPVANALRLIEDLLAK
jgi:hypothetical protein